MLLWEGVSHSFLQTVSTEHNKDTIWRSRTLTSPELCKKLWGTHTTIAEQGLMCQSQTITDAMVSHLDEQAASIRSAAVNLVPDCDFCHCDTPLHWPILETRTSTLLVEHWNDDEP